MMNSLRKQPWYLFLLPLFFVMHGFVENFGFINFWDVLILATTYVAGAIILFFLIFLLFKNRVKAAMAASFIIAFYLFFGAIQDLCKSHLPVLNRYSLLLSLFAIMFIAVVVYLKKSKNSFSKLNLFLNSLFLLYIIVDFGLLVYKNFNPPVNKLSIYPFEKSHSYKPCDSCSKPDIYFLLFDEYASSASLRNYFNFDNSLDTFLLSQGFHIQSQSTSNYNFTPFSMASLLNMSYLAGIKPGEISIEDYARCTDLIKKNAVINFLSAEGYDIVNYSIFDLAGNPSMISQDFLPLQTKLISDGTLFSRLQKDLGWLLVTSKFEIKWLSDKVFYQGMRNNESFIGHLKKSSSTVADKPRFFYAHLFMPHRPFYFDKNGHEKNGEDIYRSSEELNTDAYLQYVSYTNTRIRDLISAIKRNTNNKAVIIFMGDHGFRKPTADGDLTHYFDNQNAVYIPSKDYHLLYDSVSAVNQFRIIFNTLFRQDFTILKDSSIFLTDKK
ncbi:MAG: sulfatase-like hydrolase/transferase [Ginsengibacter sp.]